MAKAATKERQKATKEDTITHIHFTCFILETMFLSFYQLNVNGFQQNLFMDRHSQYVLVFTIDKVGYD